MNEPASDPPRPFDARMLSVGEGHWLYVEEFGLRGGRPCLFLHGGPGSGAQIAHRRLFDPNRDHAFLFDQRASGRSYPHLSLAANSTGHLVKDIETIRCHFGIERWLVTGGSWGSTLALAYAQAHPERVTGLALRAIFLGTRAEVNWAFVEGPKRFRPELFTDFCSGLPDAERSDPLPAYVRRLLDRDPNIHHPAALSWYSYERALSELKPSEPRLKAEQRQKDRTPPTPIVEAHYIANNFFLRSGELLENAWRLRGIPGVIVQGRYDLLCPPQSAYDLARAWTSARLEILEGAGHAISEAGVMDALRTAISSL